MVKVALAANSKGAHVPPNMFPNCFLGSMATLLPPIDLKKSCSPTFAKSGVPVFPDLIQLKGGIAIIPSGTPCNHGFVGSEKVMVPSTKPFDKSVLLFGSPGAAT